MHISLSRPDVSIKATLINPTIGVEIEGVDLRYTLDQPSILELTDLLHKYKVLFFHDQDITREQQLQFAHQFGTIEKYDSDLNSDETPEIVQIYSGPGSRDLYTNIWHSDASFLEFPTMGVILRAVEIPPLGGDTLFADMIAAYKGLPEDVKTRIEKLTAIHDGKKTPPRDYNKESHQHHTKNFPSYEHPVVRIHPQTQETILYVNTLYTTRINGLPQRASDDLLEYLLAQSSIPEYQVRFRWRPHSIAFWDNRSTQHYASADYGSARRYMERVALAGEKPL